MKSRLLVRWNLRGGYDHTRSNSAGKDLFVYIHCVCLYGCVSRWACVFVYEGVKVNLTI